jgi:hypothetical protein
VSVPVPNFMLVALLSLFVAQAAGLTGVTHTDPVPAQISAAVAAKLAPGGVRAIANGATITFWWVKDLPGQSWTDVPEGTLVGAVRLDAATPDIRGHVMKAGVYTLRYGIQPANTDHFGISPFRDFLLLFPAAADTDPAAVDHDGVIALSKQTLGGPHPAVLSIDPPAAKQAPLEVYTTQLGHKSLIVQIGQLKFGIVLVGRIVT